MASEPDRSSDVGNRISLATTLDMVVTSYLLSISCWQGPRARSPSHRRTPACARLGVPYLEACVPQHRHVGIPVVVTPHHRRSPSFPVLLAALVVRYGHGCK